MTSINQPHELLGKQADSSAVIEALKQIGHKGLVKIKRGETGVYINNKNLGTSMLFESERYVHSKCDISLPSEAPILVAIFLYGLGHPDFKQYRGSIYQELQFSDGQEIARKKLGKSARFSEKFNSESWDLSDKIGLIIDYSDDKKSILVAQLGIEL
jgi:hypothetical protein